MGRHFVRFVYTAGAICLLVHRWNPGTAEQDRKLAEKPPIYTFHEKVAAQQLRYASEEDEMLAMWKQHWSKSGWEPHALTLGDAQAHPQYGKINTILNSLPGIQATSRYTFLRWLAVAQAG